MSTQRAIRNTSKTAGAGMPPPGDPNRTLSEMIETIRRLHSVYERETDALVNIDTAGFLAVQDEKLECAKAYQVGVEHIMAHKSEMKKADTALKKELETLQARFSELSFQNMDALKRVQRTMERLGSTIRKAAKDEAKKMQSFRYGADGSLPENDKRRISMGLSETA